MPSLRDQPARRPSNGCPVTRQLRARGRALLAAVLLLAAAGQAAAQLAVDPSAPTVPEGPIELYLVAAYGPGLVRPATGPTLTAKALGQKRISCQLDNAPGVKARAAGVSVRSAVAASLAPTSTSPAVLAAAATAAAAAPAATTACSSTPLRGGRYTLVASYIPGATFAKWACYAMTPGAVAAASTLVEAQLTAQVVELPGGGAYTCVATYSRASAGAVSAASAINWDAAVANAATAASVSAQGACPSPPNFVLPRRASWAKPLAPLTISGNRILANNAPLTIRGINWFGFNVAMGMVDGLWAGGTDLATDFGKITYQLKLLGYNAVRLPFTWNNLANTKVWDLRRQCTPTSAAQLKQRLVDPADWASNSGKALPANPSAIGNTATGTCNDYLPSARNEDRLLYVMQQFINMGMYVVLDYQPMGTEEHAYNLDRFVGAWAALWKKISCLPNFSSELAGRVLVDVMNEPDSMGIRWEAQGDRPGAQQLYLGTADALWAATPGQVRFLFEGTGQNSFGLNWGNGFVTDINVINSRGLSNPNAFFTYLVNKQYSKYGGVIITPHVYPPTITGNTFLGAELYGQCRTAFGYLQTTGYCTGGACTRWPVLVGETGSAMSNPTDVQWLNDFAEYVHARGAAASFNSVPLKGWMWWAYNENSGDTGGIVMNGWQDVNWTKLRFMMNRLGLTPWYKQATRRRRVVEEEAGAADAGAAAGPTDAEAGDAQEAVPGAGLAAMATSIAP